MRGPRWRLICVPAEGRRPWVVDVSSQGARALIWAAAVLVPAAFGFGFSLPAEHALSLDLQHAMTWRAPRPLALATLAPARAEPPRPERPPPPDPRRPRRCSGVRPQDHGPFERRIALTFDDGPSPHTSAIADVLRRHEAPATFFVSGEHLAENSNALRAIARDPTFDVGNHTLSHRDLSELEGDDLEEEVLGAARALVALDVDASFFRFPYGRASCHAAMWVRGRGYPIVGWHVDSADWCFDRGNGRCADVERFGAHVAERNMREHVLAQARAKGGGIVLFHDNVELTSVELDSVLTALEEDGFSFVPLTDEGAFPQLNASASRARARRLRLGNRRAATALMAGRVERRWIAAAGGSTPPRTLLWPVDNAVVARGFGSGDDGYHLAVDVAGVRGSEVHSVAEGIVGYAGDGIEGYGNTVIVIHPAGLVSFYAHNEENRVQAGQRVARGEVLALLGDTGLARGPHVHFELALDGENCDPAPLFRPIPERRTGPIEGLEELEWEAGAEIPVACAPRRNHPHSQRRAPAVVDSHSEEEEEP